MISRRLLRIKVFQVLYAFFKSGETASLVNSEKELFHSISKFHDLYHAILLLVIDVRDYAASLHHHARNKHIRSQEDMNPNTRFVDNVVVEKLRNAQKLRSYINQNKVSWENNPELIKSLYTEFASTDFFVKYMHDDMLNFLDEKELISQFLSEIVQNSEMLHQVLEEQSIYWNDELEFALTMALRTIDKINIKTDHEMNMPRLFKDEEDKAFAKDLLRKVGLNSQTYKDYIIAFTKNWDFDRIAFADTLLISMALAEMTEFPSIPTRVTINEYIEISKYYSTNKSSIFINGVLDRALKEFRKANKINKQGRGLIGEND